MDWSRFELSKNIKEYQHKVSCCISLVSERLEYPMLKALPRRLSFCPSSSKVIGHHDVELIESYAISPAADIKWPPPSLLVPGHGGRRPFAQRLIDNKDIPSDRKYDMTVYIKCETYYALKICKKGFLGIPKHIHWKSAPKLAG